MVVPLCIRSYAMKMKYGNGGEGHAKFSHNGAEFLGHTKGNSDLEIDRSYEMSGGSGESHKPMHDSKFCGPTKGNKDLPINRSEGVSMGHGGGPHKAGGNGKMY